MKHCRARKVTLVEQINTRNLPVLPSYSTERRRKEGRGEEEKRGEEKRRGGEEEQMEGFIVDDEIKCSHVVQAHNVFSWLQVPCLLT